MTKTPCRPCPPVARCPRTVGPIARPSLSAGAPHTMTDSPGAARLFRWEKAGLGLFALLLVAFGVITEIRSAFQTTRRTDFGVYTRAAWAARAGEDVYYHVDQHGWHYCYPPTFAILLAPLAEPYPHLPQAGYLPFPVSAALWYVFGVACAWVTVHMLAGAVLPGLARGSRAWWYARTVPLYVCVGGIGFTLGRGQVNMLLAALVAGSFAALVRGRRAASGAWLAGAVVLKIIPALLILFPLVRRDRRALVGGAVGLVVLLGVIPAAAWGVPRAVDANRKTLELVLAPAVTSGGDDTRKLELHGAKSTDSQSIQATVNTWLHPDRDARPDDVDPVAKRAHWAVSGLLILATVVVGWRRLTPDPADQLVFLGCLCAVMTVVTPVSHMHYYAMVLPLACGLWLRGMKRRPGQVAADARTVAVLAVWGAATALPLFPGPVFDRLRECGFGTAATVGLWAFGLWTVGRKRVATAAEETPRVRLAA